MPNCFFEAIHAAFKPTDFYSYFPFTAQLPPKLFNAYFLSIHTCIDLLLKLADFQYATRVPHKTYPHWVPNHVTVQNKSSDTSDSSDSTLSEPVSAYDFGTYLHSLLTKNIQLDQMLQEGYYDGGGFIDHLLVLLCECTGIEIHVTIPARTQIHQFQNQPRTTITIPEQHFVYTRIPTTTYIRIYLEFQDKNFVNGHARFVRREEFKPCTKRKIT